MSRHLLTSEQRKDMPVDRGAIAYFPDALLLVSMLSLRADRKHSPDADPNDLTRPRWVKAKSADHGDCLVRHQMDVGEQDPENGMDYAVAVAWRALAQLQTMVDQHGITALFGPMPVTSERTDLENTPPPADEPPPVEAYPELRPGDVVFTTGSPHLFTREELLRDLAAGSRPMRFSDPELEGPDVVR